MDSIELRYQMLARIIMTGNDRMISQTIRTLSHEVSLSTLLIDKCNIPYLISTHAPHNREAQMLMSEHHFIKSKTMSEEKPKILDNFEVGLKKHLEGYETPGHVVRFLMMMTLSEDEDTVRLGYKLFVDLYIEDIVLEMLYDEAVAVRDRFPEAEQLVQKIELRRRNVEIIDREMVEEMEPEEGDSEEEEDQLDNSFESVDSGYDGESEEILMEDAEAERVEGQKFENAFAEMFFQVFRDTLKSGERDAIHLALELSIFLKIEMTLRQWRSHEIDRLINESGVHDEKITRLLEHNEKFESELFENEKQETFSEILSILERQDTVSDWMMELLMVYIKKDKNQFYVNSAVKVLLAKNVCSRQFRKHGVLEVLQLIPEKSEDVENLIEKIQKMIL